MKLFKFQEDGVDELFKRFKREKAICLAWYTGAGKTNVIVEFCARLIKANPKVRIGISCYMTTEIRDQVEARFKEFNYGGFIHVVRPKLPKYLESKNVMLFNPQGLYKAVPDVELDYLIIDESHSGMTDDCLMLTKIINKLCTKKTRTLLVSATPWDTLALKQFKNITVMKRPLDAGFKDGLVHDFVFHAEEASITFKPSDFSRTGNLKSSASMKRHQILKSACMGKFEYILNKFDKQLGQKVLVICPPGNYGEIARELVTRYGGLEFLQQLPGTSRNRSAGGGLRNTTGHLEQFREDDTRFLFVVHKCQVGFDMANLSSVIDLTMSRNIRVLAQRCGRIARKNGKTKKHYFYVYDKSLMKNQLEWLLFTMVDFCLGAYDGWTTKRVKYRKTTGGFYMTHGLTITLRKVIKAIRENCKSKKELSFIDRAPPTMWTLENALEAASAFESRTDLWSKRPSLYKWFRLNAKAEMDRVFPLKHHLGKWNERTVIKALKSSRTRLEFNRKCGGAADWLRIHKRRDLAEKHLPPSKSSKRWDEASVGELIKNTRTWAHIRNFSGARKWMSENGGEMKYRQQWSALNPKKTASDLKPSTSHKKKVAAV